MTAAIAKNGFHVMDPDLAFIAASAAVEVDNLIHGRSAGLENVIELSNLLGDSIVSGNQNGNHIKTLMDPLSTDVFTKAYSASYKSSLHTLEELGEKAAELSKELAGVKTEPDRLEMLRDFCVELSRYSSATRHTIQQSRVRNPHKK